MINPITYILRKWAFVRMGVYEFQYKSEFKISDGYNMFTYIIVLAMLSVEIGAIFAYGYFGGRLHLHRGASFAFSYVALSILVNYLIVSAVLFPYRKRHYIERLYRRYSTLPLVEREKLFSLKNRVSLVLYIGLFFWGGLVLFVNLIMWLYPK